MAVLAARPTGEQAGGPTAHESWSVSAERGNTISTRTLVIISSAILLLALAVCLGLGRFGPSTRRFGAVKSVGRDPIRPVVVAAPADAYRFWKQNGFHGRTLLFLAADWERVNLNDYNEADLSRAYPLELYRFADRFETRHLDSRNYLYVADLQGIIRRIIAVISPDAFERIRMRDRHAKNASLRATAVYETHQGFPRWFTTLNELAPPAEPVLVYVSASMFGVTGPGELLAALRSRGVTTDGIVLCSMDGDRSVGEPERRGLAEFARLLERGGA